MHVLIQATLSIESATKLQALAKAKDLNISGLVREIIENELNNSKKGGLK